MLFGASQNTIGFALDYLNIYALGTLFVQLALGLNAFITAQGYAKVSMYTVLIGAVLNIVLDPIFMFVLGMGVKGAAIATVISQGVSALWVVRFLTSERSFLRIRRRWLRLRPQVILPCLALGFSPFVIQFTEGVITVTFNTALLRYGGDLAVGGMTILASVMQFALLPLIGLTQGAQPIVSYNLGAVKPDRVREAVRLLLTVSFIYTAVLWTICMFAPRLLITLFTKDPALTAFTERALRVYMFGTLPFGLQIACQQVFIALGNARISSFLALLRKVFLLIPLIFILPQFMADRVFAVFLAEPVADLIAVVLTTATFAVAFRRALHGMEEQVQPGRARAA